KPDCGRALEWLLIITPTIRLFTGSFVFIPVNGKTFLYSISSGLDSSSMSVCSSFCSSTSFEASFSLHAANINKKIRKNKASIFFMSVSPPFHFSYHFHILTHNRRKEYFFLFHIDNSFRCYSYIRKV